MKQRRAENKVNSAGQPKNMWLTTDIHYVLDGYFKMISYSKCLPHFLFVLNICQKSSAVSWLALYLGRILSMILMM